MKRRTGFDAIVLAGGRGARLGRVDKSSLMVAGATLLDRVLAAVAGAARVVVMGDERVTAAPVTWARESPPGAGPLHALAAGLARVDAPIVVVLAADLPFVDSECVGRVTAALTASLDGVVAVDGDGRPQPLLAAYRTAALRRRIVAMGDTTGAAVSALTDGLKLAHVDERSAARDCDTWDAVEAARAELSRADDRPARSRARDS